MRTEEPDRDEGAPPLGSWARIYLLVVILAIVMMLALWAVTATWNIRMPA